MVEAAHIGNDDGKTVLMHRQIFQLSPEDPEVDHKNGNDLDNRKDNLRLATSRQQKGNTRRKSKKAPYKGIVWRESRQMWYAQIREAGRRVTLGGSSSPEEAARMYDSAARRVFGQFACVNFPITGERGAL